MGLSHSDPVLVWKQPPSPALLSWQDKTCKAPTGLEIVLPGVAQTLCLLLVGTCQWRGTHREASGWGEETSAGLLWPLRDHKKPSNNSKVKPEVCCCCVCALLLLVASQMERGSKQSKFPEMGIILEISQHGASTSNCLLTP